MYTCDNSGITNKSNTSVLQTYLWYTVMTDLPLIWRELDGVDVGMMGLWNVSISKKSRVPSSLAATTLKKRISVYIIKVYKFYCPSVP